MTRSRSPASIRGRRPRGLLAAPSADDRSSTRTRRCGSMGRCPTGSSRWRCHGQPVVATPFTLAGAMTPVSLAGALAQQNAEALFMVDPGPAGPARAPRWSTAAFTSNVDMRTGSPAFGTPEYVKAAFATGQLARRYHLPWRSSNVTASNVVDAQAAYESEMSVWGAVMGGVNLLYQGAGWLEGGLTASFEKLIVDAEILQMMAEVLSPVRRRRGDARVRGDRRGRAGRPLLRLGPHPRALRDRVLPAAAVRLAELRDVARGRRPDRDRARQHDLEAAPRRVGRAAAWTRPSARRSTRSSRAASARSAPAASSRRPWACGACAPSRGP